MFTLRLFKIKLHSRRVLILKRSLPIVAFLCASVILAWPALVEQKDKFNPVTQKAVSRRNTKIDMEEVRFFSVDDKSQPLTVTAHLVRETDPQKQIVMLEEPTAVFKMNGGVTLTSKTSYGFAFQKEEYLYFEDLVFSETDTGYKSTSSRVICDYQKSIMESDAPVDIKGPVGTLNAQGFLLAEKGNKITFKGQTKTVLTDFETPVTVTSTNGLLIDRAARKITAVSDALVQQENQQLSADTITLFYTDDPANRVKEVQAEGQVRLKTPGVTAEGQKGFYDLPAQKITLLETARVDQDGKKLAADKIVLFYTDNAANRVKSAEADGHVVFQTPTQTAEGNAAFYDAAARKITLTGAAKVTQEGKTLVADRLELYHAETQSNEIEKVLAFGHVSAETPTQKIVGDKGEYDLKTGRVTVRGNVSLTQGDLNMTGDKAFLNLKTGVSSLSQASGTKKRVKGKLIPSKLK